MLLPFLEKSIFDSQFQGIIQKPLILPPGHFPVKFLKGRSFESGVYWLIMLNIDPVSIGVMKITSTLWNFSHAGQEKMTDNDPFLR